MRQSQLNTRTYIEPKKQTVGEYLEWWLKTVAPGSMSPKQLEVCEGYVAGQILPALGKIPIAKLEELHIEGFLSAAFRSGRRDGKGGLSAQTVQHLYGFLHSALKKAVALKIIATNPCEGVKPPKVARTEMLVLDEGQTAWLLELAAPRRRLYLPILVAVTTGMRRGEIFGLKWDDLNMTAGTIHVQRALQETNAGRFLKGTKTPKGRRTITLPSITLEALRRHKREQAAHRLRVGPDQYQDRGMIFAQDDGEFIRLESFTEMFRALIRRSDLPKVRFHDLRHTHVSYLINAGENVKVISERLGHANAAMTLNVYAHLFSGADQAAASRIDTMLRAAIGEEPRHDA